MHDFQVRKVSNMRVTSDIFKIALIVEVYCIQSIVNNNNYYYHVQLHN